MAELLRRLCLRHMKYTAHGPEVMGSNPDRIKLGVRSTSV